MLQLLLSILLTMGPGTPFFSPDTWDFGVINEADGAVSHSFVLMNGSGSPLRIGRVIPGCTCVFAQYASEPVAPGKTAEVEVIFSPSGAAGETVRTLDVVASDGRSLGTLSVRADVVPVDRAITERYLYTLSDLVYVSRKDIPFGYLAPGETVSKVIHVASVAGETLELETAVSGSGRLSASCQGAIGPGKEVPVLLTYRMPEDEGTRASFRDTLHFRIDGKEARMAVTASAVCLTMPEATAGAPVFQYFPSEGSLKKAFPGRSAHGSVSIANPGRRDLVIYAVETSEGVTAGLVPGTVLHPGEVRELEVKCPAGVTEAAVRLFSNDPKRPYKELIFKLH